MKIFCLFACLMVLFGVQAQSQIIPTPTSSVETGKHYIFADSIVGIQPGLFSEEAVRFFQKQFRYYDLELVSNAVHPQIELIDNKDIQAEGYLLDIDSSIRIQASNETGFFYGMISLIQLLDTRKHSTFLPAVHIEDVPRFGWRGMHLDVSRHFFSVEEIKNFLDLMALYKFNTFHWHLTDDQGWRIEVKQYPELTSVGGFRDSTLNNHYTTKPRTYDHTRYGGFYTQDQAREIVAYAQARQITVVPEIEMPGHSRAALAAYPELSCTGIQQPVTGLWGVFDDIYCSKEESIVFLQNVLTEMLDIFPSEYIHIGGDEAPKSRWNACEDCRQVMEANHLADAHELQSYFVQRMDAFLTQNGRKLIGWDEILEGGLSANAAVMSWRGEAGGIEAAKQEHFVVMTPTSHCYLDYYQSTHLIEPLAIGGYLPLEKVYEYNPIPKEMPEEAKKFVLGGQANLWTEYIPTYDQVQYMMYPRALAVIQSLWCTNKLDYSDFLSTFLKYQEEFLTRRDVNFAHSIHYPQFHINRTDSGIALSWNGLDSNETYHVTSYESNNPQEKNEWVSTRDLTFDLARSSSQEICVNEVRSPSFDEVITYQNQVTPDLGNNISFKTPPNVKYSHNGALNLVDGILGGQQWKGSEWLGFLDSEIEMTLELEKQADLSGLTIGFMDSPGMWIYLPENVQIELSKTGKKWKKVSTKKVESTGDQVLRWQANFSGKGKFVKITIRTLSEIPEGMEGAGNVPWTFIDEIYTTRTGE